MRYRSIDSKLFVHHREQLARCLQPGYVAIVHSNDVLPTNADGTLPFKQNSDLFYLSGIDQEETILVLYPDCPKPEYREILFVRETSEHVKIWEGAKLSREGARKVSGIQNVLLLQDFPRIFREVMCEADGVYLNTNEHMRAEDVVQTRGLRFIQKCREQYPLHDCRRLAPLLHRLRRIKSPEEIALLQEACDITEAGFRRVLGFVKPGVMEYEIEAEFLHEFVRRGSRGFSYTPIIASGADSCVLHYLSNDKACRKGDVLLLDVGAEYANYAADMTRTIPVSGKFSRRQKQVYQAVLRVMRTASCWLRPGVLIQDYQKRVEALVEQELIGLKLLEPAEVKKQDPDRPLFKKYFMHGCSHQLGLDVHDVDLRHSRIEVGMVYTVEPGIYLRDEGFGIRLENDVLVGEQGNVDLMANIPVEVDEIEDLMQQER